MRETQAQGRERSTRDEGEGVSMIPRLLCERPGLNMHYLYISKNDPGPQGALAPYPRSPGLRRGNKGQ